MLQATYKSTYTFYVSTEDRRYDTDVTDPTYLRFLFKFTNNMDGRVVYAYGQDQEVYNRYTKVTFSHNTTENVFLGRVNFQPNGYYNYKVYEVSTLTKGLALSCSTAPTSAQGVTPSGKDNGFIGRYEIFNTASEEIEGGEFTGKNDLYGTNITGLSPSGPGFTRIYDGCNDLVGQNGYFIAQETAQSDDTRYLEISTFSQSTTGTTFTIISNMPVGYSYEFKQGGGAATQITNITSKPQTTEHTFAQVGSPNSAGNVIALRPYNSTGGSGGSGAAIATELSLRPITNPSTYYGFGAPLYTNPISVNGSGTILSKGNARLCIINGSNAESTTQGYYTLQGVVEEGKLYVSEPEGEEQVQYLENGKGVQKLTIVDGGAGYSSAPTITITGTNTSQATATCTISGGAVNSVTLTSSGNGYTTDPIVELSGGGNPTDPATITASITQTNYIYYGQ